MSGFDEKIQLLTERPHQRKGVNYTTLKMNTSNTLLSTAPEETALLLGWFITNTFLFYSFPQLFCSFQDFSLCVCVCVILIFSFPAAGKMINRNLSELTRLNLTKKKEKKRREKRKTKPTQIKTIEIKLLFRLESLKIFYRSLRRFLSIVAAPFNILCVSDHESGSR